MISGNTHQPIEDLPSSIFAVVAVSNLGKGSGTVQSIGIQDAASRCNTLVLDIAGTPVLFPIEVKPRETKLLLVEIGSVRSSVAYLLRDEDAILAKVRSAVKYQETFECRPLGQGHRLAPGIDITLGNPDLRLYTFQGIEKPERLKVDDELVVAGLVEFRNWRNARVARHAQPTPADQSSPAPPPPHIEEGSAKGLPSRTALKPSEEDASDSVVHELWQHNWVQINHYPSAIVNGDTASIASEEALSILGSLTLAGETGLLLKRDALLKYLMDSPIDARRPEYRIVDSAFFDLRSELIDGIKSKAREQGVDVSDGTDWNPFDNAPTSRSEGSEPSQ